MTVYCLLGDIKTIPPKLSISRIKKKFNVASSTDALKRVLSLLNTENKKRFLHAGQNVIFSIFSSLSSL